jgi:hypothetical protein
LIEGETVKTKVLFVATFAVGVIVGVISQRIPAHTPTRLVQTAPTPWPDTEEAMLERMNGFQERLNELEKVHPDSVEALSKQMEAQRGIEDLLTKYREAKQAKFAPYIGVGGTVTAAFIGGIGTWIGTWLVAGRKSKSSLQTGAAAR